MNENKKNWLVAGAVAAALAFAALVYFLHPGILKEAGIEDSDLGGGAVAAFIVWLALSDRRGLSPRARLALGAVIGAVALLGFAVYFMA